MQTTVTLRPVIESDLPIFFAQQDDADAHALAASQFRDREAFMAHWKELLAKEPIRVMTIVQDEKVAGYILSFTFYGKREVGYWLGREFWGQGIASNALAQYLKIELVRPLYGYAAKQNLGSQRVLEKCGFEPVGEEEVYRVLVLR